MMTPTIARIKRAVAHRHHVSVRAISGRRRIPQIVRSRHMAMYLARRLTRHSFTTIGRHFGGRDHTTVIHDYRRVQERVHRNQKTRAALITLIDELTA